MFKSIRKINQITLLGLVSIAFLITACQTSPSTSSVDTESNSATKPLVKQKTAIKDIGISKVIRTSTQQPDARQEQEQEQGLAEVNPLELDGSIRIAGSTIVFPISKVMVERFIEEGYSQPIDTGSMTTAKGFELFCQHKIDIVNAYRPISEEELSTCKQAGRQVESFQIAEDALALVISSQNEFLPTDLTQEEIKQIFNATHWLDVNSEWPDIEIAPTLYDLESLDTQQIITTIFNGDRQELINAPNLRLVEDEKDLIADAQTNSQLISFTSYGDYYNHQDIFKLITIDGITPIQIDRYPLVRPLFIYADVQDIKTRPEIRAFINYYLTHVSEEIEDLGYFPASQEVTKESNSRLLQLID